MNIKTATKNFAREVRNQASMGMSMRCYDDEDIESAENDLLEAANDLIKVIHKPPHKKKIRKRSTAGGVAVEETQCQK